MDKLSERLADVLRETIDALSQVEKDIIKAALERLSAYENTGMEPCDYATMRHAFEKAEQAQADLTEMICIVGGVGYSRIRELAQADKEGRLAVLPCRMGGSLYRIRRFRRGKNWQKEAAHILSTQLTMNNVANVLFGDVMGKTVFLTREEAEKALRGGAPDA